MADVYFIPIFSDLSCSLKSQRGSEANQVKEPNLMLGPERYDFQTYDKTLFILPQAPEDAQWLSD